MIKDLISADNIGLAQRVNDLSNQLELFLVLKEYFDENGNQIMLHLKLLQGGQKITAQNITTILGESNRTISELIEKELMTLLF